MILLVTSSGKTVVCENVFASVSGIGTFGSIVINNPVGRIKPLSFMVMDPNLTNTGSSLGSGSGTERLVTTSLTTGTMTSSSTDPSLVYDFSNDRFGIGTTTPQETLHVKGQRLDGNQNSLNDNYSQVYQNSRRLLIMVFLRHRQGDTNQSDSTILIEEVDLIENQTSDYLVTETARFDENAIHRQ